MRRQLDDTFEGPSRVRLPKAVSTDTPPLTPPRQFTLDHCGPSKVSAGEAFKVAVHQGSS